MRGVGRRPQSPARLFAIYAIASLLPVVLLAGVLALSFRSEANQRGVSEGRSEATLVARTAVEPLLDGRPLADGLSVRETQQLRVLVTKVTHLNSDAEDAAHQGVASVEVYQPLSSGVPARRVGVLELYLPYAPIAHDVSSGLNRLYLELAIGLAVLYLVLFAITASISRGIRRGAALNAFLAEHDVLTTLPNRTLFHRRAERLVADAQRRKRPLVLGIVDLDRFKAVNDTLGHQNGDSLLVALASRLSASVRPGDTVARLGGDEFGLILPSLADPEPVLERLREVIAREVEVSGLPLSLQASIGYVVAPDDGVDVDALVRRADVAMYLAKQQHAGVVRYDESLDQYDAASLTLVSELRQAIDEGQLVLHYQPQLTLSDGHVRAVEALVRWHHPVHGLLYPGAFLELAEQTNVIDKLTRWVLDRALRDIGALDDETCVAVNVSARSIVRPAFADDVISALERSGTSAHRLIVEVTETALLADPERAARVLERLAAGGVRISLDDFGRGQTSLSYLSALPISELKVDASFDADMCENSGHAAIVRSIIDLGHNLLLRVVGEGVETQEILAELHDYGCDVAQGFLLARPMPISELGRFSHPGRSAPPRRDPVAAT